MSDSFTEVTSEGWLSRLGGAIKGVFFGVGLTMGACALLFWNEGRAVKTARALDEGQGIAVAVGSEAVNATNEGKLIVANGEAKGTETLKDPDFGITADAISLRRKVSYYQWVEDKESKTEKKLGGGTQTVTEYTYTQKWMNDPVDSSAFKDPTGHQNPGNARYKDESFRAKEVKLGAFTLSDPLADGITKSDSLSVTEANYQALPEMLKAQVKWSGGAFYFGMNPAAPAVGDEKVEYQVVNPQTVTVMGQQTGNTVNGYKTSGGKVLESVRAGVFSKDQFFEAEKADNATMSWVLRFVGFFMAFIGFSMVLKPLSVLADVVPFIGDLVGMGTGMISFGVALTVSTVSIALGWFAYRPLLSFSLLAAAGGVGYLLYNKKRKFAAAKAATAPVASTATEGSFQKAA